MIKKPKLTGKNFIRCLIFKRHGTLDMFSKGGCKIPVNVTAE